MPRSTPARPGPSAAARPSARGTRQPGPSVLVAAVTGGIGSGKSSLCRLLRAHPGVVHLDSDRMVRGLLAASPGVCQQVAARFGPRVLTSAGRIDRARLAARVFRDARALRDLEALLHPIVLARLERKVAALKRRADVAIVVVEIPLLAEVGVPPWCDFVITVEAQRDIRLARLARRGLGPGEAGRRMARQAQEGRRRRLADCVIRNDGHREVLESGAHRLWERLFVRSGRDPKAASVQKGRDRR